MGSSTDSSQTSTCQPHNLGHLLSLAELPPLLQTGSITHISRDTFQDAVGCEVPSPGPGRLGGSSDVHFLLPRPGVPSLFPSFPFHSMPLSSLPFLWVKLPEEGPQMYRCCYQGLPETAPNSPAHFLPELEELLEHGSAGTLVTRKGRRNGTKQAFFCLFEAKFT